MYINGNWISLAENLINLNDVSDFVDLFDFENSAFWNSDETADELLKIFKLT